MAPEARPPQHVPAKAGMETGLAQDRAKTHESHARGISLSRLLAVLIKEFIQLRRDRLTFAMMMGIPIMQLFLFGYAVNTDPKHMPTAILMADDGPFTRSIIAGLKSSEYFAFTERVSSEAVAEEKIAAGDVTFVLAIPAHFNRDLVRGDRPQLLLEADASDPVAPGNALGALNEIVHRALGDDLKGSLAFLNETQAPVDVVMHRRYNPEGIAQFNIVPGILGVVLTVSMIMMTSLSLTREAERGTMENLLAMPVSPLEVMVGKITPYVGIGIVQMAIILAASRYVFGVPIIGSFAVLSLGVFVFIAAMLALGYTFSTIAKSQMQAMQMSIFFLLPSIFLSGFMFPFNGMPGWAQALGQLIPLTHFLRIVRGVILKGSTLRELLPEVLALTGFLIVMAIIALARYRRTLD
jgi:ABC-2 type transport system permease protein